MANDNDPTLREMIELLMKETNLRYTERFASQERAVAAALASAKEAVTKAEAATERRLEGLNELRGVVNDILAKTMPRIEAESSAKAFQEKLDTAITNWDSRHQEIVNRAVALEKRVDVAAGEKSGAKDTVDNSRANVATAIAVIMCLAAVFEFVVLFIKK